MEGQIKDLEKNQGKYFNDELDPVSKAEVYTKISNSTETSDEKPQYKSPFKQGEIHRSLKTRHVSMIALGGTIGTGLFIGTASPLQNAGPVSMLISYIWMGTIVFSVTQSLGEMATFIPVAGSTAAFATRFLSPAIGAANGWLYWINWAITFAIEIDAVGLVIQYWTDAVPVAAWIAICFVILTCANMFPVKIYGEVEFWIAFIKIIAIIGWLLYAFIMICGAGKTGPIGFRYWRNPGPWGPGILVKSNINTARFLGWLSSLVNAAFTFQGTELAGISAGESANPRKAVPAAINKVFYRIIIFYILTCLFIGLLVPYNDPQLNSDESYVSASPFIIAILNCGTPVLPHIINAVILSTVLSAANSNIYVGSRVLYALGETGVGPKFFTWTTPWGIPYIGVISTSLIGLLAFMATSSGALTVFNWFVNISSISGIICWACISISHIRFMDALKARGISRDDLPFKAKGGRILPWYSFFFLVLITFVQGFQSFFGFNVTDFFTAYISLIIFVAFWIFFQLFFFQKPYLYRADEIDIDTGRREIDAIVWEEHPPKNLWEKFWAIAA